MKKNFAVLGAGHLGKQLAIHIENYHGIECAGYFDDFKTKLSVFENRPILGPFQDVFHELEKFDSIVVGVGYKHLLIRQKLISELAKFNIPINTFIHPKTSIEPSVVLGSGITVYASCVLDQSVKLCDGAFLNNGVIVSHDSTVGESSFLAPGVVVSGFVEIGKRCFIGSGCVIKDGIKIANDIVVGAGSLVVNDLTKPGLYFGTPALWQKDVAWKV